MRLNKILRGLLVALVLAVPVVAVSAAEDEALRYVNATELRIINKGFEDSEGTFTRIPKYLKDSVRATLWERSMCSAGMGVRFATNSKRVAVKYRLLWDAHMPHMADTGIKGTDLYCLSDEGVWEYVNTNRPSANKDTKECSKVYVENLDGNMHEYLIYLPLYDGVSELWVGVDSVATIGKPEVDNPRASKRVVAYGTSILHGGCATRTGMASTNMIQRDLNCEVINIGISGEGKMDMCMARALASIPNVSAYIIDPVPNCTKDMCDTLTYDFVNIIRKARPEVPIIMVEGPIYSYAKFDSFFKKYLPEKNAAFRKNYERLKNENPDNLYYVTSEGLSGWDNEGTVDGIHFTDIGFRRYADKLILVLAPLLK